MVSSWKKMTLIILCLVAVFFKLWMPKCHTPEDTHVWRLIQLVTRAKVSVLMCWVGVSIASNLDESAMATSSIPFFYCLVNISTWTRACVHLLLFFYILFIFFKFYFIFKLYIIVLVLPNIKMNLPQVYMRSPSWTLLPPPSPFHPSGSSQCTSPEHPASCIEPGLFSLINLYIHSFHLAYLLFPGLCFVLSTTMNKIYIK